ncbi:hypothetical protein SLG_22280 [Sphingobium sp. SYK-6]|uniref:hypothetical protein n=1 Tax=Sphingobium sp. (strain NBRC 103272 / SYK-6) TaxID=627192 RepID=UPI0002277143|nr:hypothetical protein [Sphingobium sp. SYK-6]BAK66903.1 hypothetical protein SLG_22280 [Sphingobium sp. SYK-6]
MGRTLNMDSDFLDWLKVGGAAGVGIGGGAGVFMGLLLFFRWMLNFIAGRTDINQQRLDTVQHQLIEGLRRDVAELKAENKAMRAELAQCNEKHAEQAQEMALLRAQLGIKGVIAQEAAKVAAADTLARKERGE